MVFLIPRFCFAFRVLLRLRSREQEKKHDLDRQNTDRVLLDTPTNFSSVIFLVRDLILYVPSLSLEMFHRW